VEEVEQRLGVGVHVHEHEAAPRVDAQCAQPKVQRQVWEVAAVGNGRDAACEVVAPTVVAALDPVFGERPRSHAQLVAAVQAGVVEGADAAIGGAHDEDRLVADDVLDEVAGLSDLLFPAGDLPHARPEALHLEVDELPGDVALLRNQVGHGRLAKYLRSTSPTCSSSLPTPSPTG